MGKTHLLIPDAQVKPELTNLNHIKAAGKLARELQPEVIVNIGDWWDMPSLSMYDRGQKAAEGARYQKDIDAGNRAMDLFLEHAIGRSKSYHPKLVFLLGNHEHRIERHTQTHAWLDGKLGYEDLNLQDWFVGNFLEVATIDGIAYSHYFVNPMSGSPIGGTVENKLNKLGFSFTHGHSQKLEFGVRYKQNGDVIQGLVAGAFYQHKERYLGPQGNHHWRGICVKHNVVDGKYDLEVVGMQRLLNEYGK